MRLDGGVKLVATEKLSDVVGSNPAASTKPDKQALRDICAGNVPKGLTIGDTLTIPSPVAASNATFTITEIPLCLKTWWNNDPTLGDGEQYECHLDKGHRGNCNKGRQL